VGYYCKITREFFIYFSLNGVPKNNIIHSYIFPLIESS
jgi:hypothetical protein